jgi:hypothetical protein
MDVPMVYSPKLTFIANGNNPIGVGLASGETIYFDSLEFTVDRFGRLSLSHKGNVLGALFVGMVHSGSPSLHTIIEQSSDDDGVSLREAGSSRSPGPRGCNMVTPTVPIVTTPAPESTLALLTIPTVPVQTAALQLGIGLLPD